MKELSKEDLIDYAIETTAWNICSSFYELPKSAEIELVKKELKTFTQAIRKLIEEKPKVTKEFVEKWINQLEDGDVMGAEHLVRILLKEAGIEIRK